MKIAAGKEKISIKWFIQKEYKELQNRLFSIAIRKNFTKEDAEDLIHDTFKKLIEKDYKVSENRAFFYVSKTFHSMMVDFIRENQRNWQIIDEFIKTISGTSQEELLKKFERKERLKIVLNAINTLGRGCKLIFILLANDEIERKDICRSMGFSKGALENRILNCRDKLKKLIKYRINNFYAL